MTLLLMVGFLVVSKQKDTELQTLTRLMTGSFSSMEQSKKESDYFDVRLEMARIWLDRTDGHWLYVEQAMATSLNKPYRQRIYRLTREKDGSFQSVIFTLPRDPLMFAGAWKDSSKIKSLSPDVLVEKKGCQIVLRKQADGIYYGETVGKGCTSDLRGASYATSKVKVTSEGLETWDQGFDKNDKQVWGAVKGPYQFKRVK